MFALRSGSWLCLPYVLVFHRISTFIEINLLKINVTRNLSTFKAVFYKYLETKLLIKCLVLHLEHRDANIWVHVVPVLRIT